LGLQKLNIILFHFAKNIALTYEEPKSINEKVIFDRSLMLLGLQYPREFPSPRSFDPKIFS